jgi:hypothetical protein
VVEREKVDVVQLIWLRMDGTTGTSLIIKTDVKHVGIASFFQLAQA